MTNGLGWRWFAAWAAAGALVVFSALALASIGLFVLPFALAACLLVARRSSRWPTALGLLSGGGLVCLGIAALNRDYRASCPTVGFETSEGLRLGAEDVCGGSDPLPWLVAGIVLALAGAVLFAVVRRPGRPAQLG